MQGTMYDITARRIVHEVLYKGLLTHSLPAI